MSIYKVISVSSGVSITLQCQIDKQSPKIEVFDKSISSNSGIEKGTYLGARILKISPTSKNSKYIFSANCFEISPDSIKECVSNIRNITDMMQNPLTMQLLGDSEISKDTKHNQLLVKKMWAKEILETWYLYYSDNKELSDSDGNPWHPCVIEFDLTTSYVSMKKALMSISKFKFDEECEKGNTWLLLSDKVSETNSSNNINDGSSIFAVIKLNKDKLIIDVNSKQRANIAQDIMETEFKDLLSNPKILSAS